MADLERVAAVGRWNTLDDRWGTSETAETSDSPDFERPPELPSALQMTLAYHERTKHRPFRFAAALGYMDWDTQPDPFRRFERRRCCLSIFSRWGPELGV